MGSDDKQSLIHTPTWAVAAVCVVFVILSLLVERGIHKLGKFLLKNKQKPLYEALQKMKEELMLLGFISLLLTVARNPLSKFCMPESWTDHMLPCNFRDSSAPALLGEQPALSRGISLDGFRNRRLLFSSPVRATQAQNIRRYLAEDAPQSRQCKEGYSPLFSPESLHQLHIFIFVMAVVHVFYSCLTMLLGFTQLRGWKKWEEETRVENYDFIDGIRRSFRLERQSTFVTSRTGNPWYTSVFGNWVASFFRQFGSTVTKSDYLSLRMGFIKNHNASKKFNFHVYMMRTLEDDFKTVVGISGYLWVFVIIFMILNVHGWYAYFWISFIPILINMIIGTKLQHVITQLALETAHAHVGIGVPIKPRDELFWFNRPHLLLYLIHFVLFQNAFELAFCLWLVFTFGIHSCLIDRHGFIIIRVVVGFLAQVLCSYSTLPLYALVTQMGSHYKKAIFDEPVKNAIYGWRSKAKENRKMRQKKSFEQLQGSSLGQPTQPRFELLSEVDLFSSGKSMLSPNSSIYKSNSIEGATTTENRYEDIESRHVTTNVEVLQSQGVGETSGDTEGVLEHLRMNLQSSSQETADQNSLAIIQSLQQLAFDHVHPKSPILDRSRSNVEFSTRMPSIPAYDWPKDIDNMEIPLQPRKQRSLLERCKSLMSIPRNQVS